MTAQKAERPVPPAAPLTRDEARELTEAIKRGVERTWGQLSEAYERKAWAALDFPTWESYVTGEFGISRSRSYQLLDQARVVQEIRAAADVHTVDVTEAAARDLKPRLAEVVEQVRDAVADVPEPDRPAVVADVVRGAREQFAADRETGEVLSSEEWVAQNPPPAAAPADEWSPSQTLDPTVPRPSGPAARPGAKPTRPATYEQEFADAARDLTRAARRVEQLSADGRFAPYAVKLNDKHRGGIDSAVEGLNIVLIRMREVAARAGSHR